MSLSKLELSRYIQNLKCEYSKFTADKFAKALSYGICDIECLENKAFLVKESIKTLEKFYNDGKLCDECDLTIGSWNITHICGYLDDPFTTYTCSYFFDAGDDIDKYVNAYFTFDDDGTFIIVRENGGILNGDYTYDFNTGILTITSGNFFSPTTIVFSDNCESFVLTYESTSTDQTVIVYAEQTEDQSQDCDWQEYDITEEEAIDLYKKVKQLLGTSCSCN